MTEDPYSLPGRWMFIPVVIPIVDETTNVDTFESEALSDASVTSIDAANSVPLLMFADREP